jgi:hypothetical protein
MSTITTFDLDRFTRAAEERDVATQLSMYGRVLRTREEIQAWLEDTYGRDMTHSVKHRVLDATGAAFNVACRYPDGTNVLCATVLELDGGLISGQTVIQAWDEA